MNWLDPEDVQEWLAGHSPGYAKIEAPKRAAVKFVKALGAQYGKRLDGTWNYTMLQPGDDVQLPMHALTKVLEAAWLITQRLGGGDGDS